MALSGWGLGLAVAGGFLVYAGVKDFGVLQGVRAVVGGKPPSSAAQPHTSALVDSGPVLASILAGSGSPAGSTAPAGGPSTGSAIADAALAHLGAPYRYGAAGPNAFDCSGLIQFACAQAGHSGCPRTIGMQNVWPGAVTISASQVQAGDLVLWPYGLGPNAHGGIVVSPGQYVNAPYTGTVVQVDPIPDSLHGGPPVYRRVLPSGRGILA